MRFRLRTDFLTYARDQIRGGIWYKPAWWDAVRKVPPTAWVPRVKKADIPRITFLEDRLIRDFHGRNPVVAQFDGFASARADPRSVAALFAERQVAAMRDDHSEEAAYGVARSWLLENGRDNLVRMGVLADEATAAAEAKRRYEQEMAAQTAAARTALRAGLRARQRYRSFLEPEEEAAISARAFSAEPRLPHSEDEGEGGAPRAAGGSAAAAAPEDEGDVLDMRADAQAALVRGVVQPPTRGGGGSGSALPVASGAAAGRR